MTNRQDPISAIKQLLESDADIRRLVEQSLTQAAACNPHKRTNPVRTLDEWFAYMERFLHCMPWQAMDIGENASFFRRIDQNIGYFYFLLDQPLEALRDKGYIYPSLQYEPRIAAWLEDYNTAWGEWLSSPASWNDGYYRLALTDSRFELQSNRYESPNNWHSWNDFFARKLNFKIQNSNFKFISPCDGEIAFAPVKTATINNWLDLLGDSPYRETFAGGYTTHIVLDVFDYHRFHMPCNGKVLECRTIQGIHAGGGVIIWDEAEHRYRYDQLGVTDFQMLETRGVLVMDTPDFGKIALIPVGVQQVSSVVWDERVRPGATIRQGDELGLFRFGGSDVVLLFEQGRAPKISAKAVKVGDALSN